MMKAGAPLDDWVMAGLFINGREVTEAPLDGRIAAGSISGK